MRAETLNCLMESALLNLLFNSIDMFSCSHNCLLYFIPIVIIIKCYLKRNTVLILLLKFTARSKRNYIKFVSSRCTPRSPHFGSTTNGNPLKKSWACSLQVIRQLLIHACTCISKFSYAIMNLAKCLLFCTL